MNKPKKLSAMDLLLKSATLKPAISQTSALSRNPVANLHDGAPVEISPEFCRAWKLADRPLGEAPHKAELIKSFQQDGVGQIQPIVVRSVNDPEAPGIAYEVICGRVRWMAAKELGIPVQAIVRELDDRQAYLVMSAENRQRKNISDYAKGQSYQKALALGVFATAQEFAEAEGISKSAFSQYLGFAELPETVAEHFTDISKIPYRLGYEISRACKMLGAEAVIALIPKIESGELSRSAIQQMQTQRIGGAAQDLLPAAGQAKARVVAGNLQDPVAKVAAQATSQQSAAQAVAYAKLESGAESSSSEALAVETNAENSDGLWGSSPESSPTRLTNRPEAMLPHAPAEISTSHARNEPQLKKSFVSSTGSRLFTYNQASRGWLIRIAPDVSMRMDEALMLEFGKLLEAYLDGVHDKL